MQSVVRDPVVGAVHMFEMWHNDFYWRFGFAVDIDEDAETVSIVAVAVNPP